MANNEPKERLAYLAFKVLPHDNAHLSHDDARRTDLYRRLYEEIDQEWDARAIQLKGLVSDGANEVASFLDGAAAEVGAGNGNGDDDEGNDDDDANDAAHGDDDHDLGNGNGNGNGNDGNGNDGNGDNGNDRADDGNGNDGADDDGNGNDGNGDNGNGDNGNGNDRADDGNGNDGNAADGNGNDGADDGNGNDRNGNENGDNGNGNGGATPIGDFTRADFPYVIDDKDLPESVTPADLDALFEAVQKKFVDRCSDEQGAVPAAHLAYVLGALVRSSYFSATNPGFDEAFSDEYNKGYEQVELVDPAAHYIARQLYARVGREIRKIKGGGARVAAAGGKGKRPPSDPTVQEVTAVSDGVIGMGPVDDNFVAKVTAAHTDFVARTPVYDSLNLPSIVTDDTARAEIEPANVRAVSMIYAAGHLEMLFEACDLVAQDWSDGFIPVGQSAGKLFDAYVWNARDRLDATARDIQTSKIAELEDHLTRFCSATSERDRSQYLSEYLVGDNRRTSAQPRDAAVRKAARDLLAYASLRGWAYAQYASRRLSNHVRSCTEIVEHPEVQKAYGVQGPWQLVERVHQMNGGSIPNIAKERTLASTGKEIVDLLASKSKAIGASLARGPLFPRPGEGGSSPSQSQVGNAEALRLAMVDRGVGLVPGRRRAAPAPDDSGARVGPVFTVDEYSTLLTHVEYWLAANGINDTERVAASQIRDAGAAPSLPSFGGGSIGGFDATGARDQLLQMVANGQMPDRGQIDQLFNVGLN